MLNRYLCLLALAAGLLAGCNRTEQPTERAVALPAAPAAPAEVPAPPAPVAATPAGESMTLLLRPPAAGPAGAARSGLRRSSARQWAYQPTPAGQVAPAPAGAGRPDSVRRAALRQLLRAELPAGRTFAVRPGCDTLLMGAQGTQVVVPAGAFALPAGATEVRFEVQEFYTAADMVLAGLNTQAGSRLLETGGMLHLTATADGQPVELKPGRRLTLRLPTRQPQPDMQLFEGVAHGTARPLDWQLPATGQGTARRVAQRRPAVRIDAALAAPQYDTQWPTGPRLHDQVWASLGQAIEQQHQRRLRLDPASNRLTQHQLAVRSVRRNERIVAQVNLRFAIDTTGALGQVDVMPNSDPIYAPAAVTALQRLPRWQPARVPVFRQAILVGQAMPSLGYVTILVSRKKQVYVEPPRWVVAPAQQQQAKQLRRTADSLVALPAFRRRYWRAQDSLAYLRTLATQRRLAAKRAQLRAQFTDTTRAAITRDGVYNELQTQGLGWINCDRFLEERSLFVYRVRNAYPDAIVSLIFKDLNCVLSGQEAGDGSVAFANVPRGRWATVVALRRENGVTYLARHDVRLDRQPLAGLAFQPVTMTQLRAALKP